jgi:hypothetical protein
MARRPRIHYPGAFYHVMIRGNAKLLFMIRIISGILKRSYTRGWKGTTCDYGLTAG